MMAVSPRLWLVLAVLLGWPLALQADCAALTQAVARVADLADAGQTVTQDESLALSHMIGAIDNDALLAALRRAGLARRFGDLRNALTEVSFTLRQAQASGSVMDRRLIGHLGEAHRLLDSACFRADSAAAEGAAQTPLLFAKGNALSRNAEADAAPTDTPLAEEDAPDDRKEYLEHLSHLFWLFLVFLAVLLGGYALHYGLLILRVIRRGRRTCSIPAVLVCVTGRTDGRLSVLGRRGCVFLPADAACDVAPGTDSWCKLELGAVVIDARRLPDPPPGVSFRFHRALSPQTLRHCLSTSLIPPRYDFSVLKDAEGGRERFGLGRMPRA